MRNEHEINSWKGVSELEHVYDLIDSGAPLRWKEMRTIKRNFSEDDQSLILVHFGRAICRQSDDKASCESIIASLLIWTANTSHDIGISNLFNHIFQSENPTLTCRVFVEIALMSEVDEKEHDEEIYSMAVALVCELGLAVWHQTQAKLVTPEFGKDTLDHVTTYLLSVSNHSNTSIRLSLMHYFGFLCSYNRDQNAFNRIMNRFGHTVLDHLFAHLFSKKSEAIALQFLLENIPYTLEADSNCQRILHETFKFYMLKKPERFSLFLHALTEHLLNEERKNPPWPILLQHLGALFKVVSGVNHKSLARELVIAIDKFPSNELKQQVLTSILEDNSIKAIFKGLISQLADAKKSGNAEASVTQFRTPKRGRKPSFARVAPLGTIEQVSFLGSLDVPKAS